VGALGGVLAQGIHDRKLRLRVVAVFEMVLRRNLLAVLGAGSGGLLRVGLIGGNLLFGHRFTP